MISLLFVACLPAETDQYPEIPIDTSIGNLDTDREPTEPDGVNDTGLADEEPEDSPPFDSGDQSEGGDCDPEGASIGLPLVSNPSFTVTVKEGEPYLTDLVAQDILFFPDGALSFMETNGTWEVFLPVGNRTMTLSGPSPEALTVHSVTPVLAPSGQLDDPHEGYVGANTVLQCQGERVAFFHAEYHQIGLPPIPNSPPPYHASMGRATAPLGSTAFAYDSPSWFLTASEPANYTPNKMAYGAGGGSIFDGGEYFYLYYYDWDGDQGVHVARACADRCGEQSTWRKWSGASFDSEAFSSDFLSPSGESSVIVPATPTGFDAFNVVSYNSYLNPTIVSATESDCLRNSLTEWIGEKGLRC